LEKDSPEPRPIQPPTLGRVVSVPQVGGLHHRYERRAACAQFSEVFTVSLRKFCPKPAAIDVLWTPMDFAVRTDSRWDQRPFTRVSTGRLACASSRLRRHLGNV